MIINLTPHPVTILVPNTAPVTFPPEPTPARCTEEVRPVGLVDGLPIYHHTYGQVTGLPAWQHEVFYLVSLMVAQALPDRTDLLFPSGVVRDAQGQIVGCRGFASLHPSYFDYEFRSVGAAATAKPHATIWPDHSGTGEI